MRGVVLVAAAIAATARAAEGTAAPASADPAAAATTATPAKKASTAYGEYPDRFALPGNVHRTMNGHVFTPSLLIRSPFAVTQVGADLLYGAGTADGNKPAIIDGRRGATTYDFAAMGQNFYYDQRVADGVSVGGGLTVLFYSGISGPSAVVLGLEVGYGLFGRVTAGRQWGPVRASFTFDTSYAPQYAIHILEAIQASRDPNGDITASALTSSNGLTVKPGFALAYAVSPAVGLTLSADYQGVWTRPNPGGAWNYSSGVDAGAALDLDFGTFTTVPVAAVAAFRITAPIGSSGLTTVYDYTVGAFYTGRPPLVLGVELGQRRFKFRDLDAVANLIQFRVQYLW
jgi:hypothetical protein